MRRHDLKCWSEFFPAIRDGSKKFEIRKDDRGFRTGDVLHILEWRRDTGAYTGEEEERLVTYVMHGPVFGLADGWAILGLAPTDAALRAAESSAIERAAQEARDHIAALIRNGENPACSAAVSSARGVLYRLEAMVSRALIPPAAAPAAEHFQPASEQDSRSADAQVEGARSAGSPMPLRGTASGPSSPPAPAAETGKAQGADELRRGLWQVRAKIRDLEVCVQRLRAIPAPAQGAEAYRIENLQASLAAAGKRITELETALRRAHGEGCICVACEKMPARAAAPGGEGT